MEEFGKLVVIDASVVLSWLLPDEGLVVAANRLYDRYVLGRIQLVAPTILIYEVINALRMAVLRKRLAWNSAKEVLSYFVELGVQFEKQESDARFILDLARRFGLSAYDAAYIALGKKLKAVIYTADRRLVKAVGTSVNIKLLGERL